MTVCSAAVTNIVTVFAVIHVTTPVKDHNTRDAVLVSNKLPYHLSQSALRTSVANQISNEANYPLVSEIIRAFCRVMTVTVSVAREAVLTDVSAVIDWGR